MNIDLKTFFNKLTKELDKKAIDDVLKQTNINHNRSEIYRNFIRILSQNIYSTYLGRDYIKTNEDIIGHYDWCFNTTCEKFKLMGIDFNTNIELKDYFLEYFRFGLYNAERGKEYPEKNVAVYFNSMFELVEPKPVIEMVSFLEIYEMFNLTLSKAKPMVNKEIDVKPKI